EDRNGVLHLRWRSILATVPGDAIHAAPALYGRTLLVSTKHNIFVFGDIETLVDNVRSPVPLTGLVRELPSRRSATSAIEFGSPLALTYACDTDEIVAYTNLRVRAGREHRVYGFLCAFAVPARSPVTARPLWCHPLAITLDGSPLPGAGTFGQPALFRYEEGGDTSTGLIVNTVSTGTYLFK